MREDELEDKTICYRCKDSMYVVKNGKIKGRQRFLCQQCKKNFYIDTAFTKNDKCRRAIILYLEGLDNSEIARRLKANRATIDRWIEKYVGKELKLIRNHRPLGNPELESIHMVRKTAEKESLNKIGKKKKWYKKIDFDKGFSVIEQEKSTYIQVLNDSTEKNNEYKVTMTENKKRWWEESSEA